MTETFNNTFSIIRVSCNPVTRNKFSYKFLDSSSQVVVATDRFPGYSCDVRSLRFPPKLLDPCAPLPRLLFSGPNRECTARSEGFWEIASLPCPRFPGSPGARSPGRRECPVRPTVFRIRVSGTHWRSWHRLIYQHRFRALWHGDRDRVPRDGGWRFRSGGEGFGARTSFSAKARRSVGSVFHAFRSSSAGATPSCSSWNPSSSPYSSAFFSS